ncbi:MAG: WYL domain-containing protein, partial [Bacteroidaceae bacterium]|nr:WYL domain-containing protein [Bacteroidaceae bacterium]
MIKVARLFQTYIWIIDTIRRHNGITLEALNAQWTRTQLSDGVPIHRNSFKRYCEAIEDTFRLKVECRKTSLGYQYFLSHTQELHSNSLKNWMLSTMTVAGIVSESRNIQERILLEHVPSGETFLSEITRAMEHGHTVYIEYQKFTDSEPYCIQVEPWCLKLFRQRWY